MNEVARPYRTLADPASDHDAWLAARQQGIGSSDAPSILGLTSWGSPITVAASKKGPIPDEDREAFFWGHRLEPIILARYSELTGRPVEHYGCCVQHAFQRHLLASPDGFQTASPAESEDLADTNDLAILGPGIAEAKLVGHKAYEWKDGPPDHVRVQVQHQMMVTEYQWSTVVALMRGVELKWWDILRDDEFIEEALRPACARFWEIVQSGDFGLLEVDGSDATRKALMRLYPDDTGPEVEMPDALLELIDSREICKARIKEETKTVKQADNAVRAALGGSSSGTFSDGRSVTNRKQSRGAYTVKEQTFKVLRFKGAR